MRSTLAARVARFGCISILGSFAMGSSAAGKAWKPSPETDIIGYEVSYGTFSGKLNTTLDVGLNFRNLLPKLQEGVTYYLVVSAYNKAGMRSMPSAEIRYKKGPDTPNEAPNGVITAPSTGGTIVAGQTVDFSGKGGDPNRDTALSYRWNFGIGSGIPDSAAKNPAAVRFDKPGTYRVSLTVIDSSGLMDPTPATRTITVLKSRTVVPRTGWKLKFVNSDEQAGHGAKQAFDGNPDTFWHSGPRAKGQPPHEIQIELAGKNLINGFQYLPRQDGNKRGQVAKYEFYVSEDGINWGKAVATGKFSASPTEKRVLFTPKPGKFIRLVSLTQTAGKNDCSVAELNILQGPPPNRTPEAKSRVITTGKNKAVNVTLGGSDADGNPLTYQIVSGPKHGRLSGNPPDLTYTPDPKFTGTDTISYRTYDGLVKSKLAVIKVRVKPAASAPSATPLAAAVVSKAPAPVAAVSAPSSSARPVIGLELIDGRKYLTLTVVKTAGQAEVKRRVQVSPNLVDWFSGNQYTTVIEDNERVLKVRDNTPLAPGRKRYIRLKTGAR